MEPQEYGSAAVQHIEQAVLAALTEAAKNGSALLSRVEISRRIGIPDTSRGKQWITSWALFSLEDQGMVRQLAPRSGWSLASGRP